MARSFPRKGSEAIGMTTRGKGTRCLMVVDRQGVPLVYPMDSASPAEVWPAGRPPEQSAVRDPPTQAGGRFRFAATQRVR